MERKVPIAILEWSSLINPESIEPFLPKAPPSTVEAIANTIIPVLLARTLKVIMFFVPVLYSKCREMTGNDGRIG